MNLREWAQKNKIWNKKSWIKFVNEYLEPLYVDLWNLGRFYDFLENLDEKTLGDFEGDMKEKIKIALIGGVSAKNKMSFAKYMFDNFGVKVSGSDTFEESIESYRHQFQIRDEDNIKLEVDKSVWKWRDIERDVENLITKFIGKIGITRNQLKMIKMKGNPRDLKGHDIKIEPRDGYKKHPEDLLPNQGGKTENLTLFTLMKNLKNRSSKLAIGKNPYTTFVWYIRYIHPDYLRKFLGCSVEDLGILINFLGVVAIDAYTFETTKIDHRTFRRIFILIPSNRYYDLDFNNRRFVRFVKYDSETISGEILNILEQDNTNVVTIRNLDLNNNLYSDAYAMDLLNFIKTNKNILFVKNHGVFVEILKNSGKVHLYMVRYENNEFGERTLPSLEHRFIDVVPTIQKMCHLGLCKTVYIAQKGVNFVRVGLIFNNDLLEKIIRRIR